MWLSATEMDLRRGAWIDPGGGCVAGEAPALILADLALSPARPPTPTSAKYQRLLDVDILPALGDTDMAGLRPSAIQVVVRSGPAGRLRRPPRAYRLLATISNTAVTDQAIVRSPCTVKGAGQERADERRRSPR
jgi:hypothetical protein